MVEASALLDLFKRWVHDMADGWTKNVPGGNNVTYDPSHHADAPMAAFFADHGYDEALWLDKARVCMLTACQKYSLPDWLHDAIHAEPHTYAALHQRLEDHSNGN